MSPDIFLVVLFAAFLHALWNAIIKGSGDRAVTLGLVAAGHVVPGIFLIALYGVPSAAAFPYVVATTVIHWGYYVLLNTAYRTGDLSVVYPIARGLAPMLIALGAMTWADEYLGLLAWTGIITVSAGILFLAWQASLSGVAKIGIIAAVGVALMIASYSIVDGIGVRVSHNPGAYIGWIFTCEIFVVIFVFSTRRERIKAMPHRALWIGFFGGLVSAAAYGLVLLAKTTAPLGIVSALRETSVLFAAMIGVFWFDEGPRRVRIIAALIVAAGVALIASVKI